MTTPAELVSRLREMTACRLQGFHDPAICAELADAATTIERLSKELEEARALLSSARSDAIEAAARVADGWLSTYGDLDIPVSEAVADIAAAIRALRTEDGRGGK